MLAAGLLDAVTLAGRHDPDSVVVHRTDANRWWLLCGTPHCVLVSDIRHSEEPADVIDAVLARYKSQDGALCLTVAKVQLDVCGAWVTVANADASRSVVVRQAGWVDLRGQHGWRPGNADAYRPRNDRVGLGPGDAIVIPCEPIAGRRTATPLFPREAHLEGLLGAHGEVAGTLADRVASRVPYGPRVLVVAVPIDLGRDPRQRVADATGAPLDDVKALGYPHGDAHPELWHQPPEPPRVAKLFLEGNVRAPGALRDLLDRLLASWRLLSLINPDHVKLAAGELSANAVEHARSDHIATIRYIGSMLRIEVDDQSTTLPAIRAVDGTGGRGLRLVSAISPRWGAFRRDEGKRTWIEIPVAAKP